MGVLIQCGEAQFSSEVYGVSITLSGLQGRTRHEGKLLLLSQLFAGGTTTAVI